jgi:hypothetical protein
VGGDADGTESVGFAVVGAKELGGGSGYGHSGIIDVRIFLRCWRAVGSRGLARMTRTRNSNGKCRSFDCVAHKVL